MTGLISSSVSPRLGSAAPRVWAAVALLTVVTTLNLTDRFLPGVLAQPIKQDLSLSDTALGLINGFGFLVIYAVVGIPIARIADRGRYGAVISVCVALWSAMTALGGLAHTGLQLALTRVGVAVGEAGNSPAAHAYISRNFPPERRAAPLAVLTLSSPAALMFGTLGGGLLGQVLGWRNTFLAVGAIGILLAPVVYFFLKGATPVAATSAEARPSLRHIGSLLTKRSYLLLLAATPFIGMAGYGMNAFGPAYLMRSHAMAVGEVAVQYGPMQGIFGTCGLLIVSYLADRFVARDARWPLWIVALMLVAPLPLTAASFFAQNKWVAMVGLALGNTVTIAYQAPIIAAMQRLVPINMRATASAVLLFATALIGGAGPLIIGMISDHLTATLGPAALSRALLVVAPMLVCSAGLFLLAAHCYRAEILAENDKDAY
jgi:predicted MFS family arabinose efflux permease